MPKYYVVCTPYLLCISISGTYMKLGLRRRRGTLNNLVSILPLPLKQYVPKKLLLLVFLKDNLRGILLSITAMVLLLIKNYYF